MGLQSQIGDDTGSSTVKKARAKRMICNKKKSEKIMKGRKGAKRAWKAENTLKQIVSSIDNKE